MRRVVGALVLCVLLLLLWLGGDATPASRTAAAPHASATPLAQPAAPATPAPESAPPRGTTWVVLRVSSRGSEVVTRVDKDALPYQAASTPTATRFRLRDADGAELTGPVDWPRLCPCERAESHTRGCVRQAHTGSVRLRLPRLHARATVVIERRDPAAGWLPVDRFEVGA